MRQKAEGDKPIRRRAEVQLRVGPGYPEAD